MNLKKILLIAVKDVQTLFADRPTLVIILAAPILLTAILGLVFGQFSGGSGAPIKGIRVIVVNQDQGADLGGQRVNFGEQLASTFTNPPDGLAELVAGQAMSDPEAARSQVRSGKAAAAILIPATFSQALNPLAQGFGDTPIALEVFRDAGSPISADIITSITQQAMNSFASASIAGYAAFNAAQQSGLIMLAQVAGQAQGISQDVAQQAFTDPPIRVTSDQAAGGSSGPGFNLLGYFAPAMAVFFLNFTVAFGILSTMEERERWTLQRMAISPTTRSTILAGKLGGSFFSGVVQMAILIAATALLGPLLGINQPVWGTDILALALFVVVVVMASLGLGTIIVGLAKDRQQATVIINALMILMGIAGGAFGFSGSGQPTLGPISLLTINHWANSGFFSMAQQGVLPLINVLALLAMFVVFFGIGVTLFSRRLDI